MTPAGALGHLKEPPTLMPTARLLTNGALGGGLKHAKDETDNPSGMPAARLRRTPVA